MAINQDNLELIFRQLLIELGEDINREGLLDTPRRMARFWKEFMEYNPGKTNTTFEAIRADQMVVVSGIRVWSLCEHHLLPFWCDISVGYITDQKVLGLSKFARIAHKHAHNLQLQEKLVEDIAKDVAHITGAESVAVMGQGLHLCMAMRGIKTPAIMTSSVMLGAFRDEASVRGEFLQLLQMHPSSNPSV